MLVGPTAPRLLSSWCWREGQFPAFSAVSAAAEAPQLHQELLLGFEVFEGFSHSLLTLTVKKTQTGSQRIPAKPLELEMHFQVNSNAMTQFDAVLSSTHCPAAPAGSANAVAAFKCLA